MKTIRTWLPIVTLWLAPAHKALSETYVTTYVTKVQEERKSTRWTLTEWLRIKERMKMMDVWLAMFSDPAKDRFQPEFNLQGTQLAYESSNKDQILQSDSKATRVTAQFWLTNLVSSTVGIRTLNIDWGFEGSYLTSKDQGMSYQQSLTQLNPQPDVLAFGGGLSAVAGASLQQESLSHYSANLRIFGKNIQDSSFNLKYGKYQYQTGWGFHQTSEATQSKFQGVTYGADMQLYLFKWLGAEGSYQIYDRGQNDYSEVTGEQYLYGPFIEISVFRFQGGLFKSTWEFKERQESALETKVDDIGIYYGMKLQI
jgi:hypothetical protein